MANEVEKPDLSNVSFAGTEGTEVQSRRGKVTDNRLPTRGGIFRVRIEESSIVVNKKDAKKFNLYTRVSLLATGKNDEENEGIGVRRWAGISGFYSERAKRANLPKVLEIYDLAASTGVRSKEALDKMFSAKQVDGKELSALVDECEGKEAYAAIGFDESTDDSGRTWWNPSIIVFTPKEESESSIAANAYRRSRPPAVEAWLRDQAAGSSPEDDVVIGGSAAAVDEEDFE